MEKENVSLIEAKNKDQFNECLSIRRQVFIEEEKIDPKIELDGEDDKARHFLLYLDKKPIGTLRVFSNASKTEYHFGRVAVLKEYRGHGYGKALVNLTIKILATEHTSFTVLLNAQYQYRDFYASLSFIPVSDKIFYEAGIRHIAMARKVGY